ncbi:Uncharacterised protein [Candidatus Anstonella stagnisolia]|nr:Uncharacterised protein [Candidatus Anstonella stagnisolia]
MKPPANETMRQLYHIFIGLCFITTLLLFGKGMLLFLLMPCALFVLCIVHLKHLHARIPIVDDLLLRMERTDAPSQGAGSLWYVCGMLLLASFLQNDAALACSLFILAIGDGVSTLVGKHFGKHPIPYNKKKTMEGSLAFFLSCTPVFFLGGLPALLVAAACTVVESLPHDFGKIRLDDNLTISLACLLLFGAMG